MNGKGEILKGALEEDPPLTAEQMAERLGCGCPGVLRRNFPAEYKALLGGKEWPTRRPKREQLCSALIRALAEDPAPSVPAACQRLGISTSRVYCLYGDLGRAIAARHLTESALNPWNGAASCCAARYPPSSKTCLTVGSIRFGHVYKRCSAKFLEGVENGRPLGHHIVAFLTRVKTRFVLQCDEPNPQWS